VSKLTAKEEKFVQGVVSGLSQRKAYREAYPNSVKWKDTTVDSKASTLLKRDKVLERYNDLIEEYKEQSMWTREKAEEKLLWLLNKAEEDLSEDGFRQANSTAFLNAIKELNEIAVVYPMRAKQIEKIDREINKDETAEDKLSDYLKVLGDTIDEN